MAPAGETQGRAVKLFIGGITRNTTTRMLREHFSRYGRVVDCVAMGQAEGRPRSFGYVTFASPASAARCLAEEQVVDGRTVDMKRAVPPRAGAAEDRENRPMGGAAAGKAGHSAAPSWEAAMQAQAQAAAAAAAWAQAWAQLSSAYELDAPRAPETATASSVCENLGLLSTTAAACAQGEYAASAGGQRAARASSSQGAASQQAGAGLRDITNWSPMKVALPAAALPGKAFSARCLFGAAPEDEEDDGASTDGDAGSESPFTPANLRLPPGLMPPPGLEAFGGLPATAAGR